MTWSSWGATSTSSRNLGWATWILTSSRWTGSRTTGRSRLSLYMRRHYEELCIQLLYLCIVSVSYQYSQYLNVYLAGAAYTQCFGPAWRLRSVSLLLRSLIYFVRIPEQIQEKLHLRKVVLFGHPYCFLCYPVSKDISKIFRIESNPSLTWK